MTAASRFSIRQENVPYSPHRAATMRPKKSSSGGGRREGSNAALVYTQPTIGRSGSVLLHVADSISRWPARRSSLLPTLDPELSSLDLALAPNENRHETASISPRPSFSVDVEQEVDDIAKLVEADSWYETSRPRGKMTGLRRDHRLPHAVLPHWTGYGQASLDWDALFTTESISKEIAEDPIPRRVLNLGCGHGSWCIEMLNKPGWENTHFDGLDVAPVAIPSSLLPYEQSTRLSIVQHNMLEGLPFDDERFDFVRVAQLALSLPEHKIQDLFEEVHRILVPGGTFSIIEPSYDLFLPPPMPSAPELDDLYLPVKEAFDAVLEQRFVSVTPLSIIPSSLVMHFSQMLTGEAETIQLPGEQLVAEEEEGAPSEEEVRSRVWLHQYAQLIEGCAPSLARASIPPPTAAESTTSALEDDLPSATPFLPPHARRLTELESLITSYSTSLTTLACIPSLLTSSLNWPCTFDLSASHQLATKIIPGFQLQLEENEHLAREVLAGVGAPEGWEDGLAGEEWEREELVQIEGVRQQLGFRKREAEAELREVKARLGVGREKSERGEGGGSIGAIRIGRWRGRKAA